MNSNARCMKVQGMPPERKSDATRRVEDCAREERVAKLGPKEGRSERQVRRSQ
jgi:hypothetical protein